MIVEFVEIPLPVPDFSNPLVVIAVALFAIYLVFVAARVGPRP